jgi:hypothetical protein
MKFAYLIVAHDNFDHLKKLICVLDDKNNDIYIHIDKKCKTFNESEFTNICKFSELFFERKRLNIKWGAISQTECNINLLESANNYKYYDYFHLISGVDFPIKSNNTIHDFFNNNNGKEFIGFKEDSFNLTRKISFYHIIPYNLIRKFTFFEILNNTIIKIQQILGVHNQNPNNIHNFKKGCNWFSITNNLVIEVLQDKKSILKTYQYTSCSDEIFLQSFVYNKMDFYSNVYDINDEYHSCCRYVDWNRGNPYTWNLADYDILTKAPFLFARKFNENSTELVDKLINYIKDKK